MLGGNVEQQHSGKDPSLDTVWALVTTSSPQEWPNLTELNPEDPETHSYLTTHLLYEGKLQLMWGRVLDQEVNEPWTANFPDPSAHSFYVEATYRNSLALQEVLVSVDGGRYYVPTPSVAKDREGHIHYVVLECPDLWLARLLHGLVGTDGSDADSGVRIADFLVIEADE
jgi:hypothetical protein